MTALDDSSKPVTKPYDYAHRSGVERISWASYARLAALLAEQIAEDEIDLLVGIARAGLIPAATIAGMLRLDMYPVRLTRRHADQVIHEHPIWQVPIPVAVYGQRVALIDEIADSGETMRHAVQATREQGAAQVISAVLVSHSWAQPLPDRIALLSDALVIFPWDRQVYEEQRWQTHPEIKVALRLQRRKHT